jgi:hypothetical protein
MWHTITGLYQEYTGTGLLFVLYLAAVVFLFFREKNRERRCLFVYVPAVLLALYFQPWLSALFLRFGGEEIYYRLLWLLPVTLTLGYAGVMLSEQAKGRFRRAVPVLVVLLFVVSGSLIYASPYVHRAENAAHMPGYVVDVCDAITVPGREVMAIFPDEFLQFVRQYTPYVCMPYGRDVLLEEYNSHHEIAREMEREVIDAERLGALATRYVCHYIILPEDRAMEGSLARAGYPEWKRVDGYTIYRTDVFDLGTD